MYFALFYLYNYYLIYPVCEQLKDGASAIIDMSSSSVGPLIRSFARTASLPYITIVDQSILQPIDFDPDLHLGVEPPGSTMFEVIPDIVRHENLTKIAILYDDSFGKCDVNN